MFIPSLGQGNPPQEDDLCITISGSHLLHQADQAAQPFLPFKALGSLPPGCEPIELGSYNSRRCFALSLPESVLKEGSFALPAGLQASETRSMLTHLDASQFHAVSNARHLLWWKNNNRFCGRCGSPLADHPHERARVCPDCQNTLYPVIAPAIIVAIRKDDALLLARNANFPGNRHSIIAGFVEPGESLEQTVQRETREEVGIDVDNISYVTSQPWPFPNSLMLGFTATWKSGEICVDGKEITHAAWFRPGDELPELPPIGSISRLLITQAFNSIQSSSV